LLAGFVFVFGFFLVQPLFGELVTDGGFENTTSFSSSNGANWVRGVDAFDTWYGYAIHWNRVSPGHDGSGYAATRTWPSGQSSLLQVIQDNGNNTGLHTLSFSIAGKWLFGGVYVEGFNDDGAIASFLLSGTPSGGTGLFVDGSGPGYATIVYDSTTWTNVSYTLDLGEGYKYITIAFQSTGVPDNPRLDNVSLTPEPAAMAVLGVGGLLALRRRRRA
jgi:MYXO-CTERM domain-containing protein